MVHNACCSCGSWVGGMLSTHEVIQRVCQADSTATAAVTQPLTCITCHASVKSNPLFVCLFKTERAYSFCGTIEYMAPDIVRGGDSGHDKVCSTFDTILCVSVNCVIRVTNF